MPTFYHKVIWFANKFHCHCLLVHWLAKSRKLNLLSVYSQLHSVFISAGLHTSNECKSRNFGELGSIHFEPAWASKLKLSMNSILFWWSDTLSPNHIWWRNLISNFWNNPAFYSLKGSVLSTLNDQPYKDASMCQNLNGIKSIVTTGIYSTWFNFREPLQIICQIHEYNILNPRT